MLWRMFQIQSPAQPRHRHLQLLQIPGCASAVGTILEACDSRPVGTGWFAKAALCRLFTTRKSSVSHLHARHVAAPSEAWTRCGCCATMA